MLDGITNILGLNKSKAVVIDKFGEEKKSSLVKILSTEKIGEGKFGEVSKAQVAIGDKIRPFAIKNFFANENDVLMHSLSVYQNLRDLGVPTWSTYRRLKGKESILMTLGNKDGSLLFSANNGSEDSTEIQNEPIDEIKKIGDFFDTSFDVLQNVSDGGLYIYFDAYMFKYKDKKLDLLVGDFDKINAIEGSTEDLFKKNLLELCYALLRSSAYFEMGDDLFRKFAKYLIDKQEKGSTFLKNINLDVIFNRAYTLYMKERKDY